MGGVIQQKKKDIMGGVNMWFCATVIGFCKDINCSSVYPQEQFTLLRPSMSDFTSLLQTFKMVSCFPSLVFSYFNTLEPLVIVVDEDLASGCDKEL